MPLTWLYNRLDGNVSLDRNEQLLVSMLVLVRLLVLSLLVHQNIVGTSGNISGNTTDIPPKPSIGLMTEGYLHRRQKIIPTPNQTTLPTSLSLSLE